MIFFAGVDTLGLLTAIILIILDRMRGSTLCKTAKKRDTNESEESINKVDNQGDLSD